MAARHRICTARHNINTRRVGTNKKRVLIARVKSQCPDPLTGQPILFRINARPGLSAIDRAINSAANFAGLISIADEDFIAITRIDQDTGEVAERKIAATPAPARPPSRDK